MTWLLVGFGGVLGALLRYQIGRLVDLRKVLVSFPVATLLINVTGSFVLGLLTSRAGIWWPAWHGAPMLFFGTGMCGAYTTFSTFSYETMQMLEDGRTRHALTYILCSFIFGMAAAGIGLFGLPK